MEISTRKGKKAATLISLLMVVCIGFYIHQYLAYSTVYERCKRAIHRVHKKVAAAEKLSGKSGRIEKETALAVSNLKELDDQLPARLETARFIATVSQAAEKHNVVIGDVRTSPSDFEFWKQMDVMLRVSVSAEEADVRAWLERITSEKRRVDYNASTEENKSKKVVLTIYAMPEPEMNPPREDFCRPIDHTVWLRPFTSRIEAMKRELSSLCSQQRRMQASIQALEQLKRYLKRLNKKRAIYGEIERRHADRR